MAFRGPRIQTVPIRREVGSHLSRVCVVIQSLEQSLDGRRPKKSVSTEVVVANVLWNIPEVSCSHVGVSLSLASAEAQSLCPQPRQGTADVTADGGERDEGVPVTETTGRPPAPPRRVRPWPPSRVPCSAFPFSQFHHSLSVALRRVWLSFASFRELRVNVAGPCVAGSVTCRCGYVPLSLRPSVPAS